MKIEGEIVEPTNRACPTDAHKSENDRRVLVYGAFTALIRRAVSPEGRRASFHRRGHGAITALPLEDSNLERENQNLLCYHYTW